MTSDAALLRQYAQTADSQAFAELVQRYAALVFGVCLRINGNREDAQDVTQECFLELARKAASINTSLSGWLHGVARNKALKAIRTATRRQQRETKVTELGDDTDSTSADRLAEWAEVRGHVDEAIAMLPDELRVPIIMHFLKGQSQISVADEMGISQSAVSKQIDRGSALLRQHLAKMGISSSCVMSVAALLVEFGAMKPPAALVADLGRMALVGVKGGGSAAAGGTLTSAGSGIALKVGVAAAITVVAAGTAVHLIRPAAKPEAVTERTQLGSPSFYPSADRPIGWRGDWTGKFTGANPPVEWYRQLKSPFQHMRWSAAKPKDTDGSCGRSFHDGIITEWLVAGPFGTHATFEDGLAKKYLENPDKLLPAEGDKAHSTASGKAEEEVWRITRMKGIDDSGQGQGQSVYWTLVYRPEEWRESPRQKDNPVFYLHGYLWSKNAVKVNYRHGNKAFAAMKVYVNGNLIDTWDGSKRGDTTKVRIPDDAPAPMDLKAGWNSILVKYCTSHKKIGFRIGPPRVDDKQPGEYESKNIKYMTTMPEGRGVSMPLVVGDKVFVTCDPHYVLCIDRESGKVLWGRAATFWDTLDEKDRAAMKAQIEPLANVIREKEKTMTADLNAGKHVSFRSDRDLIEAMEKLDEKRFKPGGGDGGPAGQTPCSDGKRVYAFFGTGIAAAFDMEGNLKWARNHEIHDGTHHGFCTSPALIDGRFIVYYRAVTAYDAETGEKVWQNLPEGLKVEKYVGLDESKAGRFRGTLMWSSLVPLKVAAVNAVYLVPGNAMRATDGKVLYNRTPTFGSHACPTPVVEGDLMYHVDKGLWPHRFSQEKRDEAKMEDLRKIPMSDSKDITDYFVPSPLIYDGLGYLVGEKGVLYVMDVKAGQAVYRQQLDVLPWSLYNWSNGMDASPTLAGGRIYIMDNQGNMVVFEPGRTFKQIACNSLQDIHGTRQTLMQSSPIFHGTSIFIRSDRHLYCIEEAK